MARHLCTRPGHATEFKKKALTYTKPAQLENLTQWLQQEYGSHAVAIALVSGQEVHYHLHGQADVDNAQAVNRATLFEIGSVTKPLTALAALSEVIAGNWQLNKAVAQQVLLPQLAGHQYTLADLLSHRSGLPRLPANFPLHDLTNPYADYGREQLLAVLSTNVGSQPFSYSNFGYGLVGFLLSEQLSQPYAKVMQQRVFQRLNMQTASVPVNDANVTDSQVSTGLAMLATGYAINAEPVSHWQFDSLAGAGAVVASIDDMAAMLTTLFTKMDTDPVLAAWLSPLALPDAPAMTPGWMINEQGWLWHASQTAGFCSLVVFAPEQQKGVVILTNIAQPVTGWGMALFKQWLSVTTLPGAA